MNAEKGSENDKSEAGAGCGCGGADCCGGRQGRWIWIVLVLAVAVVLVAKSGGRKQSAVNAAGPASSGVVAPVASVTNGQAVVEAGRKQLPRLVDLGADKCIPCKMMAPVLEELKVSCAAWLDVQFIDVWKNKEESEKYGVNIIPTQIFYDPAGKELFRHEGFFSRDDILAKWKEFGYSAPGSGAK